jgi:flagellar basal-body rod modification protein FlgD
MDVMQTLSDFKQNLQAHPGPKPALSQSAAGPLSAQQAAQSAAGSPLTSAQSSPAAASASSSAGSTTITANDFLQLLVAEMKNQDPTANQDPNAYIDQLVQVNSLQQLIAINQDLTPKASAGSPTGGIARAPTQAGLGSADGTPSATLARSLAPPPRQPAKAPVLGMADLAGGENNASGPRSQAGPPQAGSPVPSAAAGISIKRSAAAWRR